MARSTRQLQEQRSISEARNRSVRRPRYPFGISITPHRLRPISYFMVIPGETMTELKIQGRMVSEPVKKILNPAYFEMWSFFVPFRVALGDDWFTFIGSEQELYLRSSSFGNYAPITEDTAGPVAVQAQPFHGFQVNTTGSYARNTLYERCLEAVYNYWFKFEDTADASFTYGIDVDTDMPALAHVDQLIEGAAIAAKPSTTVSAAGDVVYISEMKSAEARYDWELRKAFSDDRYVELLAAYGVKLDAAFFDEPELLLKRRSFLYPSRTVGQTNGNIVGQYQHDFMAEVNRPFMFREHGYVMNFVTLRPEVLHWKYSQLEALRDWQLDFHMPTADVRTFAVAADHWIANTSHDQIDWNSYAYLGEHFIGDVGVGRTGALDVPFSVSSAGASPLQSEDDALWDTANFQWTGGATAAIMLQRAAWASGLTAVGIKTPIQRPVNSRTLEKDRS